MKPIPFLSCSFDQSQSITEREKFQRYSLQDIEVFRDQHWDRMSVLSLSDLNSSSDIQSINQDSLLYTEKVNKYHKEALTSKGEKNFSWGVGEPKTNNNKKKVKKKKNKNQLSEII